MHNLNAIAALAYRDLLKFVRDRSRLVSTFIFPFIFIVALGGSLESNLGRNAGYNFLTFIFTGVFAQTLFQSATLGIISIVDDRENDFSQEIFVSPISRYAIVFGKIAGESLVALAQGVAIVILGIIIGVKMLPNQIAMLGVVGVLICLFGGAFGLIIVSNMKNRRAADQIFNFVMLPQFFLAGVFSPIKVLPLPLDILSHIAPMRYAVDLTRTFFYAQSSEYASVVVQEWPGLNLLVIGVGFGVFLVVGTYLFVRNEMNR